MATRNRRKSALARYFTPFGLSQVFDLTMLIASLVLIVGMCIISITTLLMPIGFSIFMLGALIGIFRSIKALTSGINKRSPMYKRAIVGLIILSILLICAVFGMLHYFLWM